LRKAGYIFDIDNKIIADTSQILASWSSSLQIGSARSLLDVAKTMQKALGIPQEEIEDKRTATKVKLKILQIANLLTII